MTIIAWDGNTLAADSLLLFGSLKSEALKLRKVKSKKLGEILVGLSGDWDSAEALFHWISGEQNPEKFPETQKGEDWAEAFVVVLSGSYSTPKAVLHYCRTPYPSEVISRYFAIGSGRVVASAAMELGNSAISAVELSIKLDSGCGGEVVSVSVC